MTRPITKRIRDHRYHASSPNTGSRDEQVIPHDANGRFINGTPRRCPDGTYVGDGGPITRAPDGTYVAGTPQRAPDGRYLGSGGPVRMAPDGSFVVGPPRMAPDGTYL